MSFKQYYCNKKEGMKLRSGTYINCCGSSDIWKDWFKIMETTKYGIYPHGNSNATCLTVQGLLSFLEKHKYTITEEPKLYKFYKELVVKLDDFQHKTEEIYKKQNQTTTTTNNPFCECCSPFYYHRMAQWKKSKKTYAIILKHVKRTHDIETTLQAIKNTRKYFVNIMHKNDRETLKTLSRFVNGDCAGHIMQFLA
jgi:hypothetical protein